MLNITLIVFVRGNSQKLEDINDFDIKIHNFKLYLEEIKTDMRFFGSTMPMQQIVKTLAETVSLLYDLVELLMRYHIMFRSHLVSKHTTIRLQTDVLRAQLAKKRIKKFYKCCIKPLTKPKGNKL